MRNEIRIAGFGGQGVITIGVLLAKAVGEVRGMPVAQTQSYGPESRGGACKTDVVISDVVIDYIKPLHLQWLLCMSQPALDKYQAELADTACLLVDSTLVATVPARFAKVLRIPATDMAERDLGLRVAANVVMFGALCAATGWIDAEACLQAVAETVPPAALEKNRKAFHLGYEFAYAHPDTIIKGVYS